jgi:hypothetical protein
MVFRNTSFPNGERWVPSFAHSCEHDNFNSEYLAYPPPSHIIVLHCGGNDLGQHSIGDLRELAKSQLQYAATLFPTTKIIWNSYCWRSNI